MKTISIIRLLTVLTLNVIGLSARANFTNAFDSAPLPPEWTGNIAWSAGPIGWSGGGALQATSIHGGWTMGDGSATCGEVGGGPKLDFNEAEKTEIRSLITAGNGRISFDFMVDGTSFNANAQWYQFNIAGNSSAGWTQKDNIVPPMPPQNPSDAGPWQNESQADLRTFHFETNFAAIGWTDASSSYFQIFFGANSSGGKDAACQTPDNPILFWLDNVAVFSGSATTSISITAQSYNPATRELTLTWTSAAGDTYTVQSTSNLSVAFGAVVTGIASGGATTTATVTLPESAAGFVRIMKQ